MGAPVYNLNAARNGSRLARLNLGELPAPMTRIKTTVRKYRRGLEGLCQECYGEVSAWMAHLIDSAATAEQHAAICRWLLRKKLDEMSSDDVLKCSAGIMKAKEIRDRAVKGLNLDAGKRRHADGWSFIEGHTIDDDDTGQDGPETPQDAPGGDDGPRQDERAGDATDASGHASGRDEGPATEGTAP